MPEFFRSLRDRHVPQVLVVYFGAGWVLVSILDFAGGRGLIAGRWVDFTLIVLAVMVPAVTLLAWRHGGLGAQPPGAFDKVVVPINVVVALAIGLIATRASVSEVERLEARVLESGRLTALETRSITDLAWSPDGDAIALVASDSLGAAVLRVVLDGVSPPDTLGRFSTGSGLRWTRNEGITVWAAVDSTPPELVAWGDNGGFARICPTPYCSRSPDGARTIGSWQNRPDELLVWDGTPEGPESPFTPVTLRERTMWLREVAWSPAGPLVAVLRDGWRAGPESPDATRLDVVNVDTNEQWELVAPLPGRALRFVRWTADGAALQYLDGRVLRQAGLWSLVDGRVLAIDSLGVPPTGATGFNTVSPDGRDAAYADNVSYRASVRSIDLTRGDTLAALSGGVAPVGAVNKVAPAINSDGSQIAFFDYAVPQGISLWQSSIDTVRVIAAAGPGGPVAWSPDGSRLLVRPGGLDGRDQVRIIDPTGAAPSIEVNGPLGASVTWCTPDLLLLQVPGNRDYRVHEISTGRSRLLFNGREEGWMFSPACSPDGRTIAFTYNHRVARGLWTVDRITLESRLLLGQAIGSVLPVGWSPDGRWVYYVDRHVLPVRLMRIPAEGGAPELIVHLPSTTGEVALSRDASRLATIEREIRQDVWLVKRFAEPVPR